MEDEEGSEIPSQRKLRSKRVQTKKMAERDTAADIFSEEEDEEDADDDHAWGDRRSRGKKRRSTVLQSFESKRRQSLSTSNAVLSSTPKLDDDVSTPDCHEWFSNPRLAARGPADGSTSKRFFVHSLFR